VRFTTNAGHAYENYTIRGLEVNSSDVSLNGLYGMAPDGHIPTEMLERVEVLKGPGALLNGMAPGGAVGGVVNVVTKRPTADDRTQLTTSFATGSQFGVHADVSRRFGEERRLGIRVNGSMASGETDVDDQKRRKRLGALAMDYQGDRWTLGLDAYSYRSTIANGSPLMVGFATVGHMVAAPDASLNQFRGMQAEQQSDGVMLRGTAELNDAWSVYGSLGWAEHEYTGMLNGTRGILQKDGHTLNTQTYNQYGYTKNLTGDVGVRGKFRTGAVAHELVLSMNQLRQEGGRGLNAKGGVPSASYVSDLYAPSDKVVFSSEATAYKQEKDNVITSYAVADTLSMLDGKLAVTAGLRLQQVEQKMAGYDAQATTPMLGIVAKPWGEHLSLYANYIEGLSAGTTVAAGYANAGETLKPYQTKQMEAGVKWQNAGLTHTFSLFQISKPSAISVTRVGIPCPRWWMTASSATAVRSGPCRASSHPRGRCWVAWPTPRPSRPRPRAAARTGWTCMACRAGRRIWGPTTPWPLCRGWRSAAAWSTPVRSGSTPATPSRRPAGRVLTPGCAMPPAWAASPSPCAPICRICLTANTGRVHSPTTS
jgi:iron complex outermembrane receptor protein